MPLYLVRQDLTKMDCDAIVNPSNPALEPGGGLDAAIHRAAGPGLLEACRRLGGCPVGEARRTQAFDLPCRWVIHTAGPVWRGGLFGERKKLAACYRSCFAMAQELGCATLAMPLIGAGSNRVPLELVLPVAVQTLENCLAQSEMTVYLVVFDKEAYALSTRLRADVESYIDDHYAAYVRTLTSFADRTLASKRPEFPIGREAGEAAAPPPCEAPPRNAAPRRQAKEAAALFEDGVCSMDHDGVIDLPRQPLNAFLQLDEPFSVKLLKLIDQKGMDDVACYKKANVSRQTWYKILNEKGYKPNKKTVLSFAVALELTLDETQTLLKSVGFVLSESSLFDVILMYCLTHGIYSVTQIDAILFQYDQETLYSKA